MLDSALNVLKLINKHGYEGYIVGGYVRDYLLGINSTDIDITTNMPFDLLSKYFSVNKDSIKHDSFVLSYNNFSFEVTNFRKELSYDKQRHPVTVLVNSYEEDYIRRDFTVNALCFDLNMDLIDFCNGKVDLDNKIIKTIREANLTLIEDPVRILRAIYFKNKLGFKYDELTYKSLQENSNQVSSISYNRICTELNKMCINFNLYIDDLIELSVYSHLHLTDSIMFVKNNNITIDSVIDLISIESYLGNDISKWELNAKLKKEIILYTSIVSNNFNKRMLFDNNIDIINKASLFTKLINNNIDINKLIQDLPIFEINDIDFDFKLLINLVDKLSINKIKNEIIDNILNNKLNNNNNDILLFIKNNK